MNDDRSMKQRRLYSLTSLSRYLGIGRTTMYEWLWREQLPKAAKIINKRRYWSQEQVDNFLRGNSNE